MYSTPLKAVALLELTGGAVKSDLNIRNTMGYYWTKTQIFTPLSIYDTTGTLDKTLQLLNKYYLEGYRIFLGFSRSTILNDCLEWFKLHPDAIGISIGSSADSLAIPDSFYRLQIVDSFIIDSINVPLTETIDTNGRIFYVFSEGEIATQEVYDILKERYGDDNIIPYAANNANLTVSLVNEFFTTNNISNNDSVIIYLINEDQRQSYVNLFTTTNSFSIPANQYDISNAGFPLVDSITTTLTDTYNVVSLENIITSELFNEGITYLKEDYSPNTLNALYLTESLMYNLDINNLFSYSGTLQFDDITKDIKYGCSKFYKYTNPNFICIQVYTNDPLYGIITLNKVN